MDIQTLCNIFNFKCTKEVKENLKVRQLVEYIKENNIEYSDVGEDILSKEAFIKFIENINSLKIAVKVIGEYPNLTAIEFNPELVAKFFNIYDVSIYPGSFVAELLVYEEYLKYASVEWTKEHILNFSYDKVLELEGNDIKVKENILTDENEDDYMPGMYENVEALKLALKNNILKEAIESLE